MHPPSETPALRELAGVHGIDTDFHDWQGRAQTVSDNTLRAVLAALDVDASTPQRCAEALDAHRDATRVLPPCVVVRSGVRHTVPVGGTTSAAAIEWESGGRSVLAPQTGGELELPDDLPTGYHRLHVEIAGTSPSAHSAPLIVAPQQVPWPAAVVDPAWGLAVQLYSVRSRGSWGVGDLRDLSTLARWSAREHGADFTLINPVHAGEVVAPMNPSPYLPTSRRFGNPLYLRVEAVPEYACLEPDVRAQVDGLGERVRAGQDAAELLDRDAAWAAKLDALALVHAAGLSALRRAAFDAYCAREGHDLQRFAMWCVLSEQHGGDWHSWPAALRDPSRPEVISASDPARVDFYRWLQWVLHEQLEQAQQDALEAGMRLGIVHDLAVGVSPRGADSWSYQDVLAAGVTVGAPPDAYSQLGQDWQQPPWRPDRLAELGYAPLRGLFRNALGHCGGLRVDHIIGLFRLWWIPAGASSAAGTYVHYDHEALIGILALEAERAGAVIIGEDLGNVEPWVRVYLRERGVLGTSILWFESDPDNGHPLPASRWRRDCLASVTTHDLPPTTGYLAGDHIRLRDRLGLLTRSVDEELAADRAAQSAWIEELRRDGLLAAGCDDPERVVVALHEYLTRTPARLRCVALTDAVGERRTQNQPGTTDEYPNWRIPLGGPDGRAVLLDEIVGEDPRTALVRILLPIPGLDPATATRSRQD